MDIRTQLLGILALGEASGYEIRKLVRDGPFRHFLDASFGSIYPALGRLQDEGLIEGRPETASGRPGRKVYAITEDGRAAFTAALAEAPPGDRLRSPFLYAMLFAERLPCADRVRLIDARAGWIESCLERIAGIEPDTAGVLSGEGASFVRDYVTAVFRAERAFLEANRGRLTGTPAGRQSRPAHAGETSVSPS